MPFLNVCVVGVINYKLLLVNQDSSAYNNTGCNSCFSCKLHMCMKSIGEKGFPPSKLWFVGNLSFKCPPYCMGVCEVLNLVLKIFYTKFSNLIRTDVL